MQPSIEVNRSWPITMLYAPKLVSKVPTYINNSMLLSTTLLK